MKFYRKSTLLCFCLISSLKRLLFLSGRLIWGHLSTSIPYSNSRSWLYPIYTQLTSDDPYLQVGIILNVGSSPSLLPLQNYSGIFNSGHLGGIHLTYSSRPSLLVCSGGCTLLHWGSISWTKHTKMCLWGVCSSAISLAMYLPYCHMGGVTCDRCLGHLPLSSVTFPESPMSLCRETQSWKPQCPFI